MGGKPRWDRGPRGIGVPGPWGFTDAVSDGVEVHVLDDERAVLLEQGKDVPVSGVIGAEAELHSRKWLLLEASCEQIQLPFDPCREGCLNLRSVEWWRVRAEGEGGG